MLSSLLVSTLAIVIAAPQVSEVWQGTLQTNFVTKKKVDADVKQVTLKWTKKGNRFVGEWIEGNRILAIEGTIEGRPTHMTFVAAPTSVVRGKWNKDVVIDLSFGGEIINGQMSGTLYGAGKKRSRLGTYTMRQQKSPGEK